MSIFRWSFLLSVWVLVGCSEPAGDLSVQSTSSDHQTLHRGNGADPESLDPHKSSDHNSAEVLRDLYEGLIGETPDAELVPGGAESWTVSDDGLNYVFTLRKNARWSNGDPVVAQDYVNGFRRAVDPRTASAYAQLLAPVQNAKEIIAGDRPLSDLGVIAKDPHTLEISLSNPTPYFLSLLTLSATYPIHTASLEAYKDQFTKAGQLVGNGPYVLQEFVPQSHIKLERNPYYWGQNDIAIDTVIFYNTENISSELSRYRAGELDFTFNIPPTQHDWVKENLPNELHVTPYLSMYFYMVDLSDPKFGDSRELRQALSMAIDREVLVEQVTRAGQIPAFGLVPPGVSNHETHEYAWQQLPRSEQLEMAKALYAEAGYSKDNPVRFTVLYNTGEDHRNIAVAIAAMWKQNLGAEVALENQEWKVLLKNRHNAELWDVLRFAWVGDYNDANTFLEIFASHHGQNINGYNNRQFDEFLAQASAEVDLVKRAQLLRQAEDLFMQDYAIFPLYYYVSKHLVKPHVKGFQPNIMKRNQTRYFSIVSP